MCPELQMICQEVCSWIYLAKLSDFLIRNHKIFSDRSAHRKQRLSPVNFILALRYLRLDYYKRLSIACIGKTGSGLYRILKQRASAWNACINKIWTFVYITTRFCCFMRFFRWVYLILLWFCALCAFDRYITTAFWRRFTFCILAFVVFAHWNVASIPPSHNFTRLPRLFGYYRRFMRKYQLHILYNLAYSFLIFLIAAVYGENFMMIAALFQLIILGYLSGYGVIWFSRFVRWSRCVRGAVKFVCHLPMPERTPYF